MTIGFKDGKLVYKFAHFVEQIQIEETHMVYQKGKLIIYYSNGAIHMHEYNGVGLFYKEGEGHFNYSRYKCDEPVDMAVTSNNVLLFYDRLCLVVPMEIVNLKMKFSDETTVVEMMLHDNFNEFANKEILNGDKIYSADLSQSRSTNIDYVRGSYHFLIDGSILYKNEPCQLRRVTDLIWTHPKLDITSSIFMLIDGRYYIMWEIKVPEVLNLVHNPNYYDLVIREGNVNIRTSDLYIPPRPSKQLKSARKV